MCWEESFCKPIMYWLGASVSSVQAALFLKYSLLGMCFLCLSIVAPTVRRAVEMWLMCTQDLHSSTLDCSEKGTEILRNCMSISNRELGKTELPLSSCSKNAVPWWLLIGTNPAKWGEITSWTQASPREIAHCWCSCVPLKVNTGVKLLTR